MRFFFSQNEIPSYYISYYRICVPASLTEEMQKRLHMLDNNRTGGGDAVSVSITQHNHRSLGFNRLT